MRLLRDREREDIDRKLNAKAPCQVCVHCFEDEYCNECRFYWGSNFERDAQYPEEEDDMVDRYLQRYDEKLEDMAMRSMRGK